MKIFIDTSAFIALFVPKEKYHSPISHKYRQYRKQRASLYTSFYILDELYTRLLYDFDKNTTENTMKALRKAITLEELLLLDIDQIIFKKAETVFIKFAEHKISFTDVTSYILYKDFALDEIFTLDSELKKLRVQTSL